MKTANIIIGLVLGSLAVAAATMGEATPSRRPEDDLEPDGFKPDVPGGLPPPPTEPDPELPGVADPEPEPPAGFVPGDLPPPKPGFGLVGEIKPAGPPKTPGLFGLNLKTDEPPKPTFAPDLGLLAPEGPGPDDNWGYTPAWLIPHFQAAETATGFAGFGRFLAILAWHTARRAKPYLSDGDAYEWGLANPNLNLEQQLALGAIVKDSFQVLEQNVAPLGIIGPYGGVGAYKVPLPRPTFYTEWGQIGSVGLFDLLGGYHVFAGIRDHNFTPLLPLHASVLFLLPVQLYCVAYTAFRLLSRTDLELFRLSADDPNLLWPHLAQCLESTAGYLDGSNAAGKAFTARASECGIWLSRLAMPDLKKWRGSKSVYQALGGPK